MHRRGLVRIVAVLGVVVGGLFVVVLGAGPAPAFAVGDEPSPTVEDVPSDTVTDFYPEEENLSDCVGLVEKPGCGSGSRGGWRQSAVFGVVAVGIAIIIWRIIVGVRRNRPGTAEPETPDRTSTAP